MANSNLLDYVVFCWNLALIGEYRNIRSWNIDRTAALSWVGKSTMGTYTIYIYFEEETLPDDVIVSHGRRFVCEVGWQSPYEII